MEAIRADLADHPIYAKQKFHEVMVKGYDDYELAISLDSGRIPKAEITYNYWENGGNLDNLLLLHDEYFHGEPEKK